jgi:murein DD-endopeptidase MepM/ murein hydrolase activator NlpD
MFAVGRRPVAKRHRLAFAAGGAAACAALALALAGASARGGAAAQAKATVPAVQLSAPLRAATVTEPADSPGTIRVTGTVGPDLTKSLLAAGVPERQGREYVAALATAIDLNRGLSVADRFDLVMLSDDGRSGELAYAGLDRVGRNDLELMKWTDGKTVRWIDGFAVDDTPKDMEMPVSGRLSSRFGPRFHPILGAHRMHKGVDVAAAYGAPIVAAADGRVISAGWRGGYGRQVALAHADGVQTTYSHMSRVAASAGAFVRQGQVIGYVGSTGLATGPHLHYEVRRNGQLVNPLSVKLTQSPLKGEEVHAFRSKLRALLMGQGGKA